jgi:DnaK suppressor protein
LGIDLAFFLFSIPAAESFSMNSKNRPDDSRRNKQLRDELSRRRDELYERIKAFRRDQSEEMLSTPGDVMDVAKSSIDVDTHASIIETLEQQLADIDDALKRVDEARYGICLNCGQEIPPERLRVLPSAIYCVDCQAQIGAGGGTSRATQRQTYGRWTPPPEANEEEAIADKGASPMDELSLRREIDEENGERNRSVPRKQAGKPRSSTRNQQK